MEIKDLIFRQKVGREQRKFPNLDFDLQWRSKGRTEETRDKVYISIDTESEIEKSEIHEYMTMTVT